MRMKVMVVGPTEIEDDVRQAGSKHQVYNRTPEFSEFIRDIERKLKHVFRTSNDVYILNCSGTGAMECALVNFLSPDDEVIILSGGTFGDRWLEMAEAFSLKVKFLRTSQGNQHDLLTLSEALTPNVKAVFVTANETSTGIICDLQSIGRIVRKSNAILIVDAISSLSANPLETDSWGCDVVVSSTHKALALPPGMSFITVSDKAWQMESLSTLSKYYFDLKKYQINLRRGQTPFTPPISLLYQLNIRLDKLLSEGLDNVILRHKNLSDYLRSKLLARKIQTFDSNPSNGMIAIKFGPNIDAFEVVSRIKEQHQIQITPNPEPDNHRIVRVGLFGNLTTEDIDNFLFSLDDVLRQLSS